MTYIKTSVAKPAGISPGSASPKKPNVTIFDMDDVLYMPPRDSKGIVMVGNILMKPGAKMVQIYLTRSKISAPYESDGEEDSINIKQSFEGQHPGNKKEGREFVQNWLGRNVGIIHETCDGQKEMAGTLCAPLQLMPSKQDNNDGLFHMLKFEAFAKSNLLPAIYEGELALTSIVPSFPYDGVVLDMEEGVVLAINAVDDTMAGDIEFVNENTLAHNQVISLLGNGGSDGFLGVLRSQVSGDVTVILKQGSDWAAVVGAFINLRFFKAGATSYLIEESRG